MTAPALNVGDHVTHLTTGREGTVTTSGDALIVVYVNPAEPEGFAVTNDLTGWALTVPASRATPGARERVQPRRIVVDEDILISAVRYALGRATYIVYVTCVQVRDAWPALSDRTRNVIRRDIAEQITTAESAGRTVGMSIDDAEWRDLIAWIDAAPAARARLAPTLEAQERLALIDKVATVIDDATKAHMRATVSVDNDAFWCSYEWARDAAGAALDALTIPTSAKKNP